MPPAPISATNTLPVRSRLLSPESTAALPSPISSTSYRRVSDLHPHVASLQQHRASLHQQTPLLKSLCSSSAATTLTAAPPVCSSASATEMIAISNRDRHQQQR
ncbi:hypothetical protein J5N97_022587 [Dioscorea zingiberensis]|uniref:Uncharacterized protein n=1 Tax=Dioscorea zingiberensis TaxID=325984 RepID=A0A9D5CBH9_9LILI|nr:hypothetical protein J5N97_022587 [Dioscorea zingiberensis]